MLALTNHLVTSLSTNDSATMLAADTSMREIKIKTAVLAAQDTHLSPLVGRFATLAKLDKPTPTSNAEVSGLGFERAVTSKRAAPKCTVLDAHRT